jgi:GTP cyclohydrolase I
MKTEEVNYRKNGHPLEHTSSDNSARPDDGLYTDTDPDHAGLEELVAQLIVRLGEDPGREGLARTPVRVAESLTFLTSGHKMDLHTVVNGALFEDNSKEMIIVKDIEFYSLCEHHMLPFFGKVHVGYLPNGKVIGLSKLARIVDIFARRLQVQERITSQIADAVMESLAPQGVAVVAEAAHLCMMMRGVQKQGSLTVTHAFRGALQEDVARRAEFLHRI